MTFKPVDFVSLYGLSFLSPNLSYAFLHPKTEVAHDLLPVTEGAVKKPGQKLEDDTYETSISSLLRNNNLSCPSWHIIHIYSFFLSPVALD